MGKFKKSTGFKMKNPIKFMGNIMGMANNAANSMMGMPNQNMGNFPSGLKSRGNRKIKIK